MPEGLGWVVLLLSIGYVLLFVELFIPGGIVGALGLAVVIFGCYQAFELGGAWGSAAIVLSIVVTGLAAQLFFRSRFGRRLVLDDQDALRWKAQQDELDGLLGKTGKTLSTLRPAGVVDFDGRRVDVVADGEYIRQDRPVRVIEVEGNRVVVEEVAEGEEAAAAAS